jgi:ABC-2 type transport system ATP-binding protein
MAEAAIVVDHLSKRFRLYHERNQNLKASLMRGRRARYEEFWAVKDVSFDIERGEAFGIIGHNGSGKSTMLKCLAKILRPEKGRIEINGTMSALLELGAGFHPELSGRENVYLNAAILGLSRKQIAAKFDEIVEFAGLERFIDTPVKNYSSGMYVRLGFAVAINVDPEILLIDEVLAVGDEAFQRKCGEKIADFRNDGRTIVIVSHGLGSLRSICDRVAWIDHGELHRLGPAGAVIDEYTGSVQVDREVVAERPEGDSSVRWGSGEARISSLELFDGSGAAVSRVRTGDHVTIHLELAVEAEIDDPIVGLAITHRDGPLVTGTNTARQGLLLGRLRPGATEVELDIPALQLLEGTYDITVAITDHTELHQIDRWQHAFRFDEQRGAVAEEGLVSLGGRWQLKA